MSEEFISMFLKFLKPLDSGAKNWMHILMPNLKLKGCLLFTPLNKRIHCFRDRNTAASLLSEWFCPEVLKPACYCLFKPLTISQHIQSRKLSDSTWGEEDFSIVLHLR